MRCPHCHQSISVFNLRESFACPHCGTQLKGKTSQVMLLVLCFGGIPWLLAEAAFFGLNSAVVSVVLLILSHALVLMLALRAAIDEVEKSDAKSRDRST
jgi:hypothetical protein